MARPCATEKHCCGFPPSRSKRCFSLPDKDMTNLSGTNLDVRSAPAAAALRMAPISFLCTTSPFTVPTSDHRASPCLASSPPGSAFYDGYSTHPRGSPCGPACGRSKSLLAIWSVRRLADFLQASFRPRLAARRLPSASSCHRILDQTVILLRGFHPISSCPCRAYPMPCSRPSSAAADRGLGDLWTKCF